MWRAIRACLSRFESFDYGSLRQGEHYKMGWNSLSAIEDGKPVNRNVHCNVRMLASK